MTADRRIKLFIPGPTEVPDAILQAGARPMIGHRGSEYAALHARVVPKLKTILYTAQNVFLLTSSGSGVWEAAARNCVGRRALCCMSGAFSDKWEAVFRANGKETGKIQVAWGEAIDPAAVDRELATGNYDAVAFTHSETSTGVLHDLEAVAAVVKRYPGVLLLVDAVSSMAGVKIETDRLGIDVLLASSQKAFSIPPGLAIAAVSDRAMARARTIANRGFYFDFLEFAASAEKSQTPTTPSIPQIYALDAMTDSILAEGLEATWDRHKRMQRMAHDWGKRAGFELLPPPGRESITLTVYKNTRGIDVGKLNAHLRARGMMIGNGYGKLKDVTFRISHMGAIREADLEELFPAIDAFLGA
jgi:aspartate aminotransferase-like enzyme